VAKFQKKHRVVHLKFSTVHVKFGTVHPRFSQKIGLGHVLIFPLHGIFKPLDRADHEKQ
jgi:hypothetical protein